MSRGIVAKRTGKSQRLLVSSTVDIFRQYFTYFTYFSSRNILWLDYRAFKFGYDLTTVRSKLPVCVQTIVRSCVQCCAFKVVHSILSMSRLSCVKCCLCPDYRAFNVVYVRTIVRSKLPMSGLSCVQCWLCPYYRSFNVVYFRTIVRSKLPMSGLSCVESCLRPNYRAFKNTCVQIFERSLEFCRPCILERITPPCAFILVWTYRLSVWHLWATNLALLGDQSFKEAQGRQLKPILRRS